MKLDFRYIVGPERWDDLKIEMNTAARVAITWHNAMYDEEPTQAESQALVNSIAAVMRQRITELAEEDSGILDRLQKHHAAIDAVADSIAGKPAPVSSDAA